MELPGTGWSLCNWVCCNRSFFFFSSFVLCVLSSVVFLVASFFVSLYLGSFVFLYWVFCPLFTPKKK